MPKRSLNFFPFTFTIYILHFTYLHCYYILGYLAKLPYLHKFNSGGSSEGARPLFLDQKARKGEKKFF